MKKILTLLATAFVALTSWADEAYKDNHVRFTVIDEGTIRLEYAPDGKFVDNKSFVAVNRSYPDVKYVKKENAKQVVITTSKFTLTYKKGNGPLTDQNLSIQSAKTLSKQFVWRPGTRQKGNLKGTYRTLDGFNGEKHMYENQRPMPIEDGLLATDGWTLIDDSGSLLFDGSQDWDWVTERQQAQGSQDWYFMAYGHDYKAALQSYTKFAGRVPLPPRYAFGYWWSRYWSYSDQDFRDLLENFRQCDIPLDVLVIDMDWHPISEQAGGGWTGWDWNERLFPDYRQFLAYLDQQGVKATMNLHPADGVRPFEKKYQEFRGRIGMPDGETREWLGSDKQYVKALFDTYLHPYVEDGVDFWWLDWQQWLNDKRIEGLSNTWWCNYIFFSDMERQGTKRPMLYHRWGGLGNHRYQIGFSGDSYITWESLRFLPYFNSTASNVLYGYWSHDIGGHQSEKYGTPVPEELYTRSMQMGQYLPILRTHSTKDAALNKEPWAFGQKTRERLKTVVDGRYALVPYIYTMARKDYETGISLCRPMYYDYPEAKEAYDFRNQYMFGDQMMIAPVTDPVSQEDGFARLKVWLPAYTIDGRPGEWLEYETGEMLRGGQTVERAFTMDEYPIYIKAGTILPYYGKVENLNGTEQPVTVRVFPGADKGDFCLYEDNGEDCNYATEYAETPLSYQRGADRLTVTIGARRGQYKDMPARRHYSLALPCQAAPQSVWVGGKKADFKYDGYNLEASIDLGSIDCATGTTVEVTFPASASPSTAITDGIKGRMHRVRAAVADFKQADCNMVYTENFGYLEAAPLRMTYHPETQQEVLATFNRLYDNLPLVLLEQMSQNEHMTRFLKLLNLPADDVVSELPASAFKTADGKQGFDLRFYNNMKLEGNVVARVHWDKLDMDTHEAPVPQVGVDGFSIIAESQYTADKTTDVFFQISGDDGYRVFIDDKLMMADWTNHATTTSSCMHHCEAGKTYRIRIEYYEHEHGAVLKFGAKKIIPNS